MKDGAGFPPRFPASAALPASADLEAATRDSVFDSDFVVSVFVVSVFVVSVFVAFAIRPFAPAVAVTMAIASHASRRLVGVVASPP
jgi:hypothetical protein